MPLLNVTESKRVTAVITIEESTAKQIDQYAAWTKGNPDEVVQQALAYVFGKDKEFEKYCQDNGDKKPKIALRLKKPANAAAPPSGTKASTSAAR